MLMASQFVKFSHGRSSVILLSSFCELKIKKFCITTIVDLAVELYVQSVTTTRQSTWDSYAMNEEKDNGQTIRPERLAPTIDV